MRFSFSGPRKAPSFRLSTPLGEQKVTLTATYGAVHLCTRAGELLELFSLEDVGWHTCVLPSKEHCLALRVPSCADAGDGDSSPCSCGAPRELLLRSKHRDRVDDLNRQLCLAAAEAEQQRLEQVEAAGRAASGSPRLGRRRLSSQQHQLQLSLASPDAGTASPAVEDCGSDLPLRLDPRTVSFGSPVAEAEEEEAEAVVPRGLAPPDTSGCHTTGSSPKAGGGGGNGQHPPQQVPRARPPIGVARSAPGSPVLPGLPLVAQPARPSASAPVSPAHRQHRLQGGEGPARQVQDQQQGWQEEGEATAAQPSVRLLSFTRRPGSGAAAHRQKRLAHEKQQQQQEEQEQKEEQQQQKQSHVQRLEHAVAQLSAELAQTRASARAGPATAGSGGTSGSPSRKGTAASTGNGSCADAPARDQIGEARDMHDRSVRAGQASRGDGSAPEVICCNSGSIGGGGSMGTSATSRHVELLLQENSLLLQQQGATQAELARLQAQLSAAAADNVRLAQEAAGAVRQLQAASAVVTEGQQREGQLRASLGSAVAQCEAVGRELAGLSTQLEARSAQCQELRGTVDALSAEKSVLTAALTTAQLQLRDATPAGFAAEAAELRRQAEAALQDAAAARAATAAAEARVAEARRQEAEVEGHMREAARCMADAQATRAAGLAREEALAAEIRSLRLQLSGQTQEGDPAKPLQDRIEQLSAANTGLQRERAALVAQLQQLQSVGQELSSSCRALEARQQEASKGREALAAELSRAQAAHHAAAQRWEQQRQQLESALAGASGKLAGSEDSCAGLKSQVQALQAQLDSWQREARDAQAKAAAREHELQTELRLLSARAEAAGQAARERTDAAAAAAAAEAGRHQEALHAREAQLAAARREVELLAAEQARLQEELRRSREERTVVARDSQLEATSAKAEAARLAQELQAAHSAAQQAQHAAEEARRAAQQAQAQAAAAVAAHTTVSQERKELQGRLDRLSVEVERAVRARDTAELKCSTLQQQCRLLEAVAQGQAALGGGAGSRGKRGSKENGGEYRIKAHRRLPLGSSGSD